MQPVHATGQEGLPWAMLLRRQLALSVLTHTATPRFHLTTMAVSSVTPLGQLGDGNP